MLTHKVCSKCGLDKPAAEFHARKDRPCGLQPKCKACVCAYAQTRRPEQRAAVARYRERNPDKGAAYMRARRLDPDFVEKVREYMRARYPLVAEQRRAYTKQYRAARPEETKIRRSEWWEKNPGARNAARARHYAAKRQAIPAWANLKAVAEFYRKAKVATELYGSRFEVDHIVPLQSPVVCGLHVEDNLRVIPATENRMKLNALRRELLSA